jgi:beta-1,4-mannosyl-glycoprotein beta-1,4-N-acetylglucosaminyltransferase
LIFCFKFNLKLENYTWFGSKACKFKNLRSPQWLRDIKTRKFPWWRIDTLFSNRKYKDIYFVKNGGWHFSYLKKPKEIEKKLKSYLHHCDYDRNPLGVEKIKKIVDEKKPIYDLKVDQRKNKFEAENQLVRIKTDLMPSYLVDNLEKYKEWIDND